MNEIYHYDALLETYRKQEAPLAEKRQELADLMAKYRDTMQNLANMRNLWDEENLNLIRKKMNLIENFQQVLNTCEENNISWTEIKEKQARIEETHKKASLTSEYHIDIVQGIKKDLKQLDTELQLENVAEKIKKYKENTENNKELLAKLMQEFERVSSFKARLPAYQVLPKMRGAYKEKIFPKNLGDIETEIAKINKNLLAIDVKLRELHESS